MSDRDRELNMAALEQIRDHQYPTDGVYRVPAKLFRFVFVELAARQAGHEAVVAHLEELLEEERRQRREAEATVTRLMRLPS